MARRRIKKGELVSFYDSLQSWLVTGSQLVPTLKGKKRYLKIERIIPKPRVKGLALPKDLVIR